MVFGSGRSIRTALALLACAGLAACATAGTGRGFPPCDKLDTLLRNLQKNAAHSYTAQSIDKWGNVRMYYINPKTRKWAQIKVHDDLSACIELEGTDWQWALEPAGK
jgi:hypothetical protein